MNPICELLPPAHDQQLRTIALLGSSMAHGQGRRWNSLDCVRVALLLVEVVDQALIVRK
ncbi:MAG: hypothetical protein IPM35_36155 [Myxococcales bacterium]|nr:hypothetical protein [Myxococcales bacterium]